MLFPTCSSDHFYLFPPHKIFATTTTNFALIHPFFGKKKNNTQISMQSLFGGIFYLLTTVVAWNEFSSIRQENKIRRQMYALNGIIQQQHRHQQQRQ